MSCAAAAGCSCRATTLHRIRTSKLLIFCVHSATSGRLYKLHGPMVSSQEMTTAICATVYLPYLRTQPSGSPPTDGAATARAFTAGSLEERVFAMMKQHCPVTYAWFWLHLLASGSSSASHASGLLCYKSTRSKRAEANTHLAQVQKCVPIDIFPFISNALLKNQHATKPQWLCIRWRRPPHISHAKLPVRQEHRNSSKLKGPFKGAMVA